MPGSVIRYRGPARFGFELAAQLGEVDPQVARVGVLRPAAHRGQQRPSGDELARVAQQDLEQLPLGRGQMDPAAVGVARRLRGQVDLDVADPRPTPTGSAAAARRVAARSRASSSSMLNGLVT